MRSVSEVTERVVEMTVSLLLVHVCVVLLRNVVYFSLLFTFEPMHHNGVLLLLCLLNRSNT